ncbi:MAG: TonB-dependent receptor [Saprospiraceae bacterium]
MLLAIPTLGFAQSHTISGTLRDAESGESLIGASVYIPALGIGTTSNAYGFYSLTAPARDSVTVVFAYLGYEAQVKKIYFTQNYKLDVSLLPGGLALKELEITAQKPTDDNVQRPQMGVIDIPVRLIRELPAILGETDVLKVIQLLPGVQAGNEGTTGFFVRGGNADQNLVQLDEATVYNPNHLFGLVSTFNSRALNNVTLVKGGFPANHGGRLSSILDISMKEGNNQEFVTQGGIGLLSSQLTVEGPIGMRNSRMRNAESAINNQQSTISNPARASFIVSGRRTYLDILAKPFIKKNTTKDYHFYDLNAKVNWRMSGKDRLYASFFQGRDIAGYTDPTGLEFGLGFGNRTGTLRWNHLFGQKLFLNSSFFFNSYFQNYFGIKAKSYTQFYTGIEDYSGKMEFQYFPNARHRILFGAQAAKHDFTSSGKATSVPKDTSIQQININKIKPRSTDEAAVYLNDEWALSKRFALNLGLRAPAYRTVDTTYFRLEPRASLKISLNEKSSLKASYTQMNQFLHLVSGSTAALPTDLWIPSSRVTQPQRSEQYALGYFRNFMENKIEASVEAYYKTMQNQVLFGEGTQLLEQTNFDDVLVYGKGESYGVEFFVKKNFGKLNGWVSYTLSKTTQQFDAVNLGREFPFKYDRRHNLAVVGVYKLSKRWTVSADFVYYSGAAFTLPGGRFMLAQGGSLYSGHYWDYADYNNHRLKSYHRLDVAATRRKTAKFFKWKYESEMVFSLYNLYSRQNQYFVYTDLNIITNKPVAKQVALLPIIPGFSYNFKF